MGRLSLLMTVVSRNLGEKYLKFYLEQQVEVQLVTLGRGTANDAMLDYFGLESRRRRSEMGEAECRTAPEHAH